MPTPPQYQALERTGTQMVAAARQGDWAGVAHLESVVREQVSALKATHAPAPTCPQARQARLEALKALLRLDAQVRALAEPGWNRVERWLGAPASRHGQVGAYSADTLGKH